MAEPKVRFKRDDGSSYPDIQQVPFGNVVKPFTEKTKTENEDVLLSCAINGVFLNTELFGHQRGASNKGYKKIRRNTLILSAQNLHLGNANVNQRFDHGIISPAYNTYDIVGCNPDYMAQWVKRDATKKFFYDATTTGASQCRRNVDWNALYEQIFYVPCEEEQQKIADFLSSVDDVISTSEQEVANLETQKKAVMKKIFSQEVRFKRADGSDFPEWDEMRIDEAVVINPRTPAIPDEFYYMDLGSVDHGQWLDKNIVMKDDAPSRAQRVADMGDVFFQSVRPYNMGHYCLDTLLDKTVVASTGFLQIRCNNMLLNRFLFQLLFEDNFNKEVDLRCTGQAYPSINTESFSEIMIGIPCIEEQRLIADFLSDFDGAIVAAKKELELWKELKKGLLQQMFV